MSGQVSKKPSNILRFSLRAVLTLITLICVFLGYFVTKHQRDRNALAELNRVDAYITFADAEAQTPESAINRWGRRLLGVEHDPKCITHVEARALSDLDNLRRLSNLKQLHLHNQWWKELTPLRELSQLELLEFTASPSSNAAPLLDLGPISNCKELKELSTQNIKIVGLSALSKLTKLSSLTLWGSELADLSPLKNLHNLEHLYVDGSQVDDLAFLQGMNELRALEVSGSNVSDLSVLATKNYLHYINLSNNPIVDLRPLRQLQRLDTVNLAGCKITDLSCLFVEPEPRIKGPRLRAVIEFMQKIEGEFEPPVATSAWNELCELNLAGNPIKDVSVLGTMGMLSQLNLSCTKVDDLSSLKDMFLRKLKIDNTELNDLQSFPVNLFDNQSELTVGGKNLNSLKGIGGGTGDSTGFGPETLRIANASLTDLEPLKELKKCSNDSPMSLIVANTPIEKFPMELITPDELHWLMLKETEINELVFSEPMQNLSHLNVSGSPVHTIQGIENLTGIVEIVLHDSKIDDASFLEKIPVRPNRTFLTVDLSKTLVTELSWAVALSKGLSSWSLNIANCRVSDLSHLRPQESHGDLTSLNISRTDVSDFQMISQLIHLQFLDISETTIESIAEIHRLQNIESGLNLNLAKTRIKDFSPLREVNVSHLNLSQTQFSDLSDLEGSKDCLATLDISHTAVSDFSQIGDFRALTNLNIEGIELEEQQIEFLKNTIPAVELTFDRN